MINNFSQNEKNEILSMHKTFAHATTITKFDYPIFDSLISEIKNILDFQKKIHIHHLSMLNEDEKIIYIDKIKNKNIYSLFKNDSLIVENFKNFIFENISDYSKKIDYIDNFVINSLIIDNKLIYEQISRNNLTQTTGVGNLFQRGANAIRDKLTNAANYLKQNGVDFIFENIRTALLSGIGTAIQTAFSFTGAGVIANEIAWGVMTMYDGYQNFTNKKLGSISNLCIDIFCLLTSGNLGKTLSKFVNLRVNTIKDVFQAFLKGGVGKYISPIVKLIQTGLQTVSKFLNSSVVFMESKMGINWVRGILGKIIGFFEFIAKEIANFFAPGIANVAKPIIRLGTQLTGNIEKNIFRELAKKSDAELTQLIGKKLTATEIKMAEEYVEENFRDKPINDALIELDKRFGVNIGDAYAAYLKIKNKGK